MRPTFLVALACVHLVASPTMSALMPTWPVEHAVERAELIVIGKRGGVRGDSTIITVVEVLHGKARKGDTILVRGLQDLDTTGYSRLGGWYGDKEKPIELKDRPVLLCLSRKGVAVGQAADGYEVQTTGYGTAVKVLDGDAVYGYYQHENPGPYHLVREGNSREVLLRRIERGLSLSRRWAEVKSLKEQGPREEAILAFLKDRSLPEHFCSQACFTLKNSKLAEVIRDEVENGKDPTKDGPPPAFAPPDARTWTRLATALMYVEDSQELLPLLEKVRTARPEHYGDAVRCAMRVGDPGMVPFLKRAMLDIVECDAAGLGLFNIRTQEARVALNDALRTLIVRNGSAPRLTVMVYTREQPAAWGKLAGDIDRKHPSDEKVQKCLRETWQALAQVGAIKPDAIPAKYRSSAK